MKRIAIIVRAETPERVSEALRAALGLGLRGDAVDLVLAPASRRAATAPRAARALALLGELGRPPREWADLGAVLAAADAVEVWT